VCVECVWCIVNSVCVCYKRVVVCVCVWRVWGICVCVCLNYAIILWYPKGWRLVGAIAKLPLVGKEYARMVNAQVNSAVYKFAAQKHWKVLLDKDYFASEVKKNLLQTSDRASVVRNFLLKEAEITIAINHMDFPKAIERFLAAAAQAKEDKVVTEMLVALLGDDNKELGRKLAAEVLKFRSLPKGVIVSVDSDGDPSVKES